MLVGKQILEGDNRYIYFLGRGLEFFKHCSNSFSWISGLSIEQKRSCGTLFELYHCGQLLDFFPTAKEASLLRVVNNEANAWWQWLSTHALYAFYLLSNGLLKMNFFDLIGIRISKLVDWFVTFLLKVQRVKSLRDFAISWMEYFFPKTL